MFDLLSELASMVTAGPIMAALVLCTLLALLAAATLAFLYHHAGAPKKAFLIGLAAGIPIMTPALVQSRQAAAFAMNLSLADLLVPAAALYLLHGLLKRSQPLQVPLFWLCLAYTLWAALSIVIGGHTLRIEMLKISHLVSLLKIVALFLYFYVILNLIEDLGDMKVLLKFWIITGTLVGLLGIGGALAYQLFHIRNFAAGDFRAMGTLGNPNLFAGYLTTTFLLSYVYIVLGGNKRFLIPCMVTHGVAILLSASKGSVAAFAVGAFTLMVFLPRRRVRILALALGTLTAAAVVYLASDDSRVYMDRILSITDLDDKSHQRRLALWTTSLEIWEDHALFGVGLGNFALASPEQALPEGTGTKWSAAGLGGVKRELAVSHSTYLSLLCEMGLPGLFLFLAIFLCFVFTLLRRISRTPASEPALKIHAALLASIVSTLAQAGVANVENSRAIWASLGIIFAYELKIFRKDIAHTAPVLRGTAIVTSL
ncbi:MAG: O-antigen ligase family protein [bacterium]